MAHYLTAKAGRHYLRVAIPCALQEIFGRQEVSYPLPYGLKHSQAKAVALGLASKLLDHFNSLGEDMKQHGEPSLAGLLEKFGSGEAKEFERKVNYKTGEIYVKPDVTNPQDVKDAAEWEERQQEKMLQLQTKNAKEQRKDLQDLLGIKSIKLTDALDEYIRKLKKKTDNENDDPERHRKNELEHFRNFIINKYPNCVVHKINGDDLEEYREVLESIVSNKSKQADKKFSVNNVRKRLQFVETFFRYCQDKKYMQHGDVNLPTFQVKPEKLDAVDNESSYVAFTEKELEKIFNPLNINYIAKKSPHNFFGPFIGAFLSPRVKEFCYLKLSNINNNNKEKIWTFNFADKTKNKNSRRIVPVHPALIEIGFLEYLEDVKEIFGENSYPFPYVMSMEKALGGGFGKYLDTLKIQDKRKTFHSFRKNVAELMLTSSHIFAEHYIGHLPSSVHYNIYSGRVLPFQFYLEQLENVKYNIDFSKFKYNKGDFLPYLISAKATFEQAVVKAELKKTRALHRKRQDQLKQKAPI